MLRLRYWRHKRKLTLKELQARTRELAPPGISYQQLSAYEIGTVEPPLRRIYLLSEALDVSIAKLVVKPVKIEKAVNAEEAIRA